MHSNYVHKPNRRERQRQARRDRRLLRDYALFSTPLPPDRKRALYASVGKTERRIFERRVKKKKPAVRIRLPKPSQGGYNKQTRLEAMLGFVKRAKKIKKIMGGSK